MCQSAKLRLVMLATNENVLQQNILEPFPKYQNCKWVKPPDHTPCTLRKDQPVQSGKSS